MTRNRAPDQRQQTLEPIDELMDHVRGGPDGRLIVEYGEYDALSLLEALSS